MSFRGSNVIKLQWGTFQAIDAVCGHKMWLVWKLRILTSQRNALCLFKGYIIQKNITRFSVTRECMAWPARLVSSDFAENV